MRTYENRTTRRTPNTKTHENYVQHNAWYDSSAAESWKIERMWEWASKWNGAIRIVREREWERFAKNEALEKTDPCYQWQLWITCCTLFTSPYINDSNLFRNKFWLFAYLWHLFKRFTASTLHFYWAPNKMHITTWWATMYRICVMIASTLSINGYADFRFNFRPTFSYWNEYSTRSFKVKSHLSFCKKNVPFCIVRRSFNRLAIFEKEWVNPKSQFFFRNLGFISTHIRIYESKGIQILTSFLHFQWQQKPS